VSSTESLGINWGQPWFLPWRTYGEVASKTISQGEPVHKALNHVAGSPVRFVPQGALAPGAAYEHHIHASGECPTRENLHDFFNGLCWLGLPLSKKRLNALQAAQIAARGTSGPRGPVRDAITVFDENGAVLDAPPPLWGALLARDWKALFIDLRPLWQQARLLIVGHALLEKLVAPRKDMTAHVWCTPAPSTDLPQLDAWLATQLTEERLAGKPFTPLPVMGTPGWCAENQNFCYYDDSLVFRPSRARAR